MNMSSSGALKRFYLLDFARGIAALSIVFWHYQHFYRLPGGGTPLEFSKDMQPLYDFFWLFYEHGHRAVYFFFVLSGFIFFQMYLEKISTGDIGVRKFIVLRFSRLYPLHFVTLIFVALLQYISLKLNGVYLIYKINDIKHFFLNIFLISQWGFESGWSFNAPFWSVSLEIFAYSFFFCFAKLKFKKLWHVLVLILLLLTSPFQFKNHYFTQVIFCFFSGGATSIIFNFLVKKHPFVLKKMLFVPILAAIIIVCAIDLKTEVGYAWLKPFSPEGVDIILHGILFPAVVLLLALFQKLMPESGRKISIIGDLTYSMYMLHIPLQLLIILLSQQLRYTTDLGISFFIPFLTILIVLSYLTYTKFEKPAQKFIRNKFYSIA